MESMNISWVYTVCAKRQLRILLFLLFIMSGLLFENNTIVKVRENANRHGGKNATVTKWRHWWQLLGENEKNIQNTKYKSKVQKHLCLFCAHITSSI